MHVEAGFVLYGHGEDEKVLLCCEGWKEYWGVQDMVSNNGNLFFIGPNYAVILSLSLPPQGGM